MAGLEAQYIGGSSSHRSRDWTPSFERAHLHLLGWRRNRLRFGQKRGLARQPTHPYQVRQLHSSDLRSFLMANAIRYKLTPIFFSSVKVVMGLYPVSARRISARCEPLPQELVPCSRVGTTAWTWCCDQAIGSLERPKCLLPCFDSGPNTNWLESVT